MIINIADPFYPELALGVQKQVNALGHRMMRFNTDHSMENEKRIIQMLGSKGVDGMILSTVQQNDPNIELVCPLRIY